LGHGELHPPESPQTSIATEDFLTAIISLPKKLVITAALRWQKVCPARGINPLSAFMTDLDSPRCLNVEFWDHSAVWTMFDGDMDVHQVLESSPPPAVDPVASSMVCFLLSLAVAVPTDQPVRSQLDLGSPQ